MRPNDLIDKIRSCNQAPGDKCCIFSFKELNGSNGTGVCYLRLQSNEFLFTAKTLLLALRSLFLSLERNADKTDLKSLKEALIRCASRFQAL